MIVAGHDVLPVAGFRVAGIHAGLKATGMHDMALIVSDRPCAAAGVFTTNRVQAAPVIVDQAVLAGNRDAMRAIVINTTCANACTGDVGIANARRMIALTTDALGIPNESAFVLSTGVIGTHLPMAAIERGIDAAVKALGDDWLGAARGIMTTDTRPKYASVCIETPVGAYTIAGIAKGAGMIAPNMATMLGVIVTDAIVSSSDAQAMLTTVTERSFNRIVIDGDMSTNDTVLLLANGASGIDAHTDWAAFHAGVEAVAAALAKAIVLDGEGATKFITLQISGAATDADAQVIATTIATSPLVKTAFYGGDANWGRIIAAAGRAGVAVDPSALRLSIAIGEPPVSEALLLFEDGMPTAYDEAQAGAIMKTAQIVVLLDCGMGSAQTTLWTCDLSHDYVSVNGHYRS